MKSVLVSGCACIIACSVQLTVSGQGLAAARALGQQGKVDAAIVETQRALAASPQSAAAELLLCQLQGSVDHFDEAVRACEAAHQAKPTDSNITLELARAYGAKAEHAGALTGLRMVGRIRDAFEAAVQQDPKNVEALSDLGEFYLDAPAIVGGGSDRARALVPRLQVLSPARAARLQGMIAAKDGDASAADAAFARELAVEHSAEAYVDLARYDQKRKLYEQAERNAALAIQRDGASGPDSLDAARLLMELHRNSSAAEQALRGYLSHPQNSSVARYAQAHVMLGRLLAQRGDKSAAQDQFNQALALASNYSAAQKGLRG